MKKNLAETRTVRQNETFFVRAIVDSKSIIDTDEEKSFDVVFATETPVKRYSWSNDEIFNEILICDRANIRTQRLDALAIPLIDNHNTYGSVKVIQLGRADSYTIANKECRAKILFSLQDNNADLWKDIKAGIIRTISAGYNVYKYLREEIVGSDIPNYRAIDWEPTEISLAPVPADFNSAVRKKDESEGHEVIIENFLKTNKRSKMENEQEQVVTEQKTTTTNEAGSRSAQATQTVQTVDENKIRSEAIAAERKRVNDINHAVRSAKLPETFSAKLIEDGVSVDQARAMVIDELAKNDKTPNGGPNVSIRTDEVENTRSAIVEGIMHRAEPGSVKNLADKSQDFKHLSLLEIGRRCLELKGERPGRYSASEVVTRAFSTTDFPLILGTTVKRFLNKFYETQNFDWKKFSKQINAVDFRQTMGLNVSGKVSFEEIAEGGDYKESAVITSESATMKLKTYGRKITIDRKAIINDDLGVFNYLPNIIAMGASNFQANKVWALITGNAKTPDGKTLFHVDHKNILAGGAGSVLSNTSLSAARAAMWRQLTPAGEPFPVTGKFLVVPAELQTVAEQLMTQIMATATPNVNVFASKFDIVVDPRLTDVNQWYLVADPSYVQGIVHSYLQGEEGLHVENFIDPNNDKVVTKARVDFDCNVWDYRGWLKSPGA